MYSLDKVNQHVNSRINNNSPINKILNNNPYHQETRSRINTTHNMMMMDDYDESELQTIDSYSLDADSSPDSYSPVMDEYIDLSSLDDYLYVDLPIINMIKTENNPKLSSNSESTTIDLK